MSNHHMVGAPQAYGNIVGAPGLYQITGADMQPVLVAPPSPQLVDQPLIQARELLLGIGDIAEGGMTFSTVGQGAVFTTQPQLPFRPSRFVIPDDLAALFYVDDFKIGKNSQFLSSLAVPGAVFSQLAVGVALGLDTCVIGQQITVSVTFAKLPPGEETPAVRFLSAVIGTAMQ